MPQLSWSNRQWKKIFSRAKWWSKRETNREQIKTDIFSRAKWWSKQTNQQGTDTYTGRGQQKNPFFNKVKISIKERYLLQRNVPCWVWDDHPRFYLPMWRESLQPFCIASDRTLFHPQPKILFPQNLHM